MKSLALSALTFTVAAFGQPAVRPALPAKASAPAAAMDALLGRYYKADQPGAAVLVMKEGKVVYKKGYGLAHVELGVPLQPDMVFRIGSVTKQFTAAAVLLLAEEGKVDLQAPAGRYLKDLPAAWEKVTVEQLLNHTSGIPSYTNDPAYMAGMREDLTPAKILERVRTQPLLFEPGTSHRYTNTGYVVLGMLLEQLSGKPYGEVLHKRLFEPLGLKRTRYGMETDLIPGMVSGYAAGPGPAAYLSMTQPFAAGALVSNAEDLARWNLALHTGKVVKPETLARMTAPTRTADGKAWPYGFGLGSMAFRGRTYVMHGGGINGFSSFLLTDPQTRMAAVILNNSEQPPVQMDYLGLRLLALAAGEPMSEPRPAAVDPAKLNRLAGRYRERGAVRVIRVEGGKIFSQVGGAPAFPLIPLSDTEFAFEDSDVRLRFVLEGDKVLGVHRSEYQGEGPLQQRLEAQDERRAIRLDPAAFDPFAGRYELAPGFVLTFWREGERFFSQATGQRQVELFPSSPTRFFLKVVEAEVEFVKDGEGKVTEVVLYQGGRRMPGKRIS